MGRKNTYEEGYVFPSGIILVKRIGKDKYRTAICDFKCPKCGKIFRSNIGNIARGRKTSCGCDKQDSIGEYIISNILSNANIKYIQQYCFDDCKSTVYNKKLPFDFYLPDYNCCIEYDGEQHSKPIKHFGGVQRFERQIINDNTKNVYCHEHNIVLIRFNYDEIKYLTPEYVQGKIDYMVNNSNKIQNLNFKKINILIKLYMLWEQYPDQRFGQIISNYLVTDREDIFYIEDDEISQRLTDQLSMIEW